MCAIILHLSMASFIHRCKKDIKIRCKKTNRHKKAPAYAGAFMN